MCQRVRAAQGGETRFVIKVHKATDGSGYCLSRGSADWERRLAACYFLWRILERILRFFRPSFLRPFPLTFVPTVYLLTLLINGSLNNA